MNLAKVTKMSYGTFARSLISTIMTRTLKRYLWLAALAILSLGIGFYAYKNPALKSWEEDALDFFFALRPSPRENKIANAVLVMVDGKSVGKRYGYYDPLPRRYLAELIDTLSYRGARLIAMDIALFDKHDVLDPKGDSLLFQSISRAGNVAAVSAYEVDEAGAIHVRNPHAYFLEALRGVGYANLEASSVGSFATVRSVKPFVKDHNNTLVPSFSTLVYCLARGLDVQKFMQAQIGAGSVDDPDRIPRDNGAMVINFVGPPPVWQKNIDGTWIQQKEGRIVTYRSSSVTDGTVVKADAFDGKVVFVGSFSEFALDQFLTPYYGFLFDYEPMRGVEVHANAFLTIEQNRFIRKLTDEWILILLASLALVTVVLTSRFNFLGDMISVAGILAVIWGAGYGFFEGSNIWVPAVSFSSTVILSYVSTTIYTALTEKREKRRITNIFGQYVDERVVQQLIEHPEMSKIGGVHREVTVLFSDLKGFTKMSERLGPEKTVKLMNIYLTEMTEIIRRNEGTIDKFIGDSIMAFWGAPVPNSYAPYLACVAALQMQARLEEIKSRWNEFGDVEVRHRIGINTGICIVGNVGSAKKTNYTAIGDAVNLASRLEGVNKRFGTSILISDSTRLNVADKFIIREIERVAVDGRTQPETVYELRDHQSKTLPANVKSFLDFYNQGLTAYKNREWDEASALFEHALNYLPEDPVCKVFIEKIKLYKIDPSATRSLGA